MLRKVPNSVDQLCKGPGGRCSHDSPEATPRQETESRLARGQSLAGDAVTICPRPTMDGDAVTARTRLTPNKQCIFDSSEGISAMLWKVPNFADQLRQSLQGPGREMQSRLT